MKKLLLIFLGAAIALFVMIVVPNFLTYNWKAIQSEARHNLKSIYESELKYRNTNSTFTEKISLLNWKPDEYYHKRYRFYLTEKEVYPDDDLKLAPYLKPYVARDSLAIFAVYCVPYPVRSGENPKYDVWMIDEKGNLRNIVNEWY